MPLDSRQLIGRPRPVRPVRQFVLDPRPGSARLGFLPRLYFEARIDLSDVRSGIRGTCGVHQALQPIQPETADAVWTADMARPVDSGRVRAGSPAAGEVRDALPPFVTAAYLDSMEGLYLAFLIRHWSIPAYRNFHLGLYSEHGESRPEFEARCLDAVADAFRGELDAMHETFGRKIEQVREKYLPGRGRRVHPGDFDGAKLDSMLHAILHERSERITGRFLAATLAHPGAQPSIAPDHPAVEFEQRLVALEEEAGEAIGRLGERYAERARTLDEYTVRPNFKDIHLVRSGVLWIDAFEDQA